MNTTPWWMRPGVSIILNVLGSLASWVIAVSPGSCPGYPFGLEEYVTDETIHWSPKCLWTLCGVSSRLNWEKCLAFCFPYGIFTRSILNIPCVSSAVFPSLKHNVIQMFVLGKHIFVWITGAEIACFVMFGSAFAHKHFFKVPSKVLSLIVWWTENILVY
jgi:hypothetical protein